MSKLCATVSSRKYFIIETSVPVLPCVLCWYPFCGCPPSIITFSSCTPTTKVVFIIKSKPQDSFNLKISIYVYNRHTLFYLSEPSLYQVCNLSQGYCLALEKCVLKFHLAYRPWKYMFLYNSCWPWTKCVQMEKKDRGQCYDLQQEFYATHCKAWPKCMRHQKKKREEEDFSFIYKVSVTPTLIELSAGRHIWCLYLWATLKTLDLNAWLKSDIYYTSIDNKRSLINSTHSL